MPRLRIVYPVICLTTEENHGNLRVAEKRLVDQRRTRFVWSTCPSRAMASTFLLATAALGLGVRRRVQPSVSVIICLVAVLRCSPLQLTLSQSEQSGLWCGRQTAEHPHLRVSACYLRTRGHHYQDKDTWIVTTVASGHGCGQRTSTRGTRSPSLGGWAAFIAGLSSWRKDQSSYPGEDPACPSSE